MTLLRRTLAVLCAPAALADTLTTWIALQSPNLMEGNPGAAALFAGLGFWPAQLIMLPAQAIPAALLWCGIARLSRPTRIIVRGAALLLLVGKLAVVASNVAHLAG